MICPKCNEPLYDNGTVAVHRWNATDKLTIESQACKPAATGSGEPKCPTCMRRTEKDSDGNTVHRDTGYACCPRSDSTRTVPTPPASQPTVTLDRETFDLLIAGLSDIHELSGTSMLRSRAKLLIGILRAAGVSS